MGNSVCSNQADGAGIFLAGQLRPFIATSVPGVGCGVLMLLASLLLWLTLR